MKLSDKLIKLRKENGWSQEEFAEKLEVSRQAISRWENGTALPDAQNIVRISKLYNLSADYLLNDDLDEVAPSSSDTVIEESVNEEALNNEVALPTGKKKHIVWNYIAAGCFAALLTCAIILAVKQSQVHIHSLLGGVKENEIAPTCASKGSYDEVVYCSDCNEEVLREMKTVEKLSHTLSASKKENEVAPTCASEGSYDEVVYCTECKTELLRETKTVEKLSHTLSASKKEKEVAATCTKAGSYDEVVYCTECKTELLRETKTVEKLSHTLSPSKKEKEVAPACNKAGSYDEVVYCSVCDSVLLRTRRSIEMLEHQFEDDKCILCNEERPSEGLAYMSNGDGTCFVDGGECTDERIVIPSYSPSGEKVSAIRAYAFAGNQRVKSVYIPETVDRIGEGAFQSCKNLESVNLPSKLTVINSYTFLECESLKEITIPSRVYYIGIEAFAECISCESITIPASVKTIGIAAFRNFSNCKGTVTFMRYDGWWLYDDSDEIYDWVDFQNVVMTPTILITYLRFEYTWKRI